MQMVQCLNDLERFGIIPLTGDACGLLYRVLFDVTANGQKTLQRCFGLTKLELNKPWHSGGNEDPHVGSLMLAPEMLPAVGIFGLLESGCVEIWRKGDTLFGIELDDDEGYLEEVKKTHGPLRRFAYRGDAGDGNVNMPAGSGH